MFNLVERHKKLSDNYFDFLHDECCPAHNMGAREVFQNTKNL